MCIIDDTIRQKISATRRKINMNNVVTRRDRGSVVYKMGFEFTPILYTTVSIPRMVCSDDLYQDQIIRIINTCMLHDEFLGQVRSSDGVCRL